MTTERSDKVFDSWRQAAEKFDYFILGVTGALCAYISQVYKPARLGLNPDTLELLALILLVCSAIVGFRRIERSIEVTLLNHRLLRTNEERGALVSKAQSGPLVNESTGDILSPQMVQQHIQEISAAIPNLRIQAERASTAASRAYHLRNWLILIGFGALMYAKVWSAYV
jgi:hypothetical protein